jgi:hypothetical protein
LIDSEGLAWWNPASRGKLDVTLAWKLDEAITQDIITVFALAVLSGVYPRVYPRVYPHTLGYGPSLRQWSTSDGPSW